MESIVNEYESVRAKSFEEDKLILDKQDREEKKNYLFAYEEIIR